MARRKATVRVGRFLGLRISAADGGVMVEFHGNLIICSWNRLITLTHTKAKQLGQALIDIAETVEKDRGKS